MNECFRCGTTNNLERFGSSFICPACTPTGKSDSGGNSAESTTDGRFDTTGDHENPIDVSDVTDAERAEMLREYLKRFVDEFGTVPRLMPLDGDGKEPIIRGRARLDSPVGREFLVDGQEAIRQIREERARGFAIYAGKWDHGTEDVVFVDHDDVEEFPTPTAEPTLEVLSGSGRGPHETFRNAGDVQNARVANNVGEIRAENWYVVTPGSVHPSGGVYHMIEDRDIATLSDEDLDDSMRPAGARRDHDDDTPTAVDLDDDGDVPPDDTIQNRLERAFANSHDGDRIEAVYNGRYRAAGFDDRSAAEFWLANRLDAWVGLGNEQTVRTLMDQANLQKWPERRDESYRRSVLSQVGYQDWYYDPDWSADDGRDESTSGRAPEPETCEPPTVDITEFDRDERWRELQEERYDEHVSSTGPTIWADHAGAGKTTNAGRAAAQRDRDFVALFDKHEKAREFVLDEATPDVDFHLKGGEQKRHDHCMDADHHDEQCHEHPGGDCPHMCPIYDLNPDHEARQQYEAIVEEVGPVRAHMILDLPGHDDDGSCSWLEQFDDLETADRVVGVHEYQLLKTVRDGRDVIVDESPSALMSDREVSITDLARTATALDGIADLPNSPDSVSEWGRFAHALVDALAGGEADDLAAIDPPEIDADTYYEPVDPDDLPDDVAPGDVEQRRVKEDVGMPEEGYARVTKYVVERSLAAEEMAKAKLSYNETIISRMRRDAWNGAPLVFDALLAAAGEAGADPDACRQAIAVPTLLETCPWCGSDVEHHNGTRRCTNDDCDWHEEHHRITRKNSERARALARLDLHDGEPVLSYHQLPSASELPESPLILDATATPSKVAALYGVDEDDVDVHGDELLESNLHVTQILDGQYHAGTIQQALDDERTLAKRIQRTIDTVGELHRRPLFIGPKALLGRFEFPDHGETLHYHAARGLNRAECDAVVCIGAPHPNVEDLTRQAELLAQDRDDVRVGGEEFSTRPGASPPVYRKLLFEDEHGNGRAIATKHFSGLVGDLWRESRENELVQAVHRIRPLLAEDVKHAYLLTNVPTDIPIDELATFEELADPLEALLPVPEGALDLLGTVHDVVAGDGPDGFRASQLVDQRPDGSVANKVEGYHRLATLAGLDVSQRTVYNWVHALEDIGLLEPETYEQHAGVSYAVDFATLQSALSVMSGSTGFKVAATRRLRSLLSKSGSGLDWLAWARDVFDLQTPSGGGLTPTVDGGGPPD